MTCRELVKLLIEYLDGQLPERERARFEEHLAECPDCAAYLASYQETVRLGKAACEHAPDTFPAGFPEELVRAILRARHGYGGHTENEKPLL